MKLRARVTERCRINQDGGYNLSIGLCTPDHRGWGRGCRS